MEEQKVILIVEDDEVLANNIEHGLHHLVGTEHQIPLRTSRATEPGAMQHIDLNYIDLVLLDINLAHNTDGIDFPQALRKKYPYIKIIVLTRKGGNDYKILVHEKIKCVRFFTKPIEWEGLSGEVVYQLRGPSIPKERLLPVINFSRGIYRIPRSGFLFLRGIKGKKKIEVFTVGENPEIPGREILSIAKHQSFEKFADYMIPPEEKELIKCEAVTIVNAPKIVRVCKADHYLILEDCKEKIWIDPAYRPKIYTMFKG